MSSLKNKIRTSFLFFTFLIFSCCRLRAQENFIINGTFTDLSKNGLPSNWQLNPYGEEQEYAVIKGEGPESQNYTHWGCKNFSPDKDFGSVFFQYGGAPLKSDTAYKIRFYAKSSTNSLLQVSVQRIDVWKDILFNKVELKNDWDEYSFSFVSSEDVQKYRISFCPRTPGFIDITSIGLSSVDIAENNVSNDAPMDEKLVALLSVKETPPIAKEEFLNLLKEKYKELTEKYQDPDTGLIYCASVKELKGEINNTVEDILKGMVKGVPAPHGYGTSAGDAGICDTSLFGGQMLYSMLEAYDVQKDTEIEGWARLLFNGMKIIGTASPVPGFIVRGPHPNNRQAYYKDSSMDQHSTYVLALWRYYNSPLATEEDKTFIRDSLDKVATRLEKNNWRILWEDDSQEAHAGGGDLTAFHSEAVTLLMLFVGATADVTQDKRWKDMYEKFATERDGMRWKVLMPNHPEFRMNAHPLWGQQGSFRTHCLYSIEKDPSRRNALLAALKTYVERRMMQEYPLQKGDEWQIKSFGQTLTPDEAGKLGWKKGYCENAVEAWKNYPQNYKDLPDSLKPRINQTCVIFPSCVFTMGIFSRNCDWEEKACPLIMDMVNKADINQMWSWPQWGVIVPAWKAYALLSQSNKQREN